MHASFLLTLVPTALAFAPLAPPPALRTAPPLQGRSTAVVSSSLLSSPLTPLGVVGLTTYSLTTAAPPLPLTLRVAGGALAASSLGLGYIHTTVTYGYGLALALHAIALRHLAVGGALAPQLLLATCLLYGVKVCLLQAARDASPAYKEKVLPAFKVLELTGTKCPFTKTTHKIPFVLGVAALLTLYAYPLYACATAGAVAATGARSAIATTGAGAALGALCVQSLADRQKFAAKASLGADAPILGRGLWSLSRHPNYAAEIIFHTGVAIAALAGCTTVGGAWLSAVGPAVFISIMLGATGSLEKRQANTYRGDEAYAAYVSATPRLFPFAPQPAASS